jgi:hypothetical protein
VSCDVLDEFSGSRNENGSREVESCHSRIARKEFEDKVPVRIVVVVASINEWLQTRNEVNNCTLAVIFPRFRQFAPCATALIARSLAMD